MKDLELGRLAWISGCSLNVITRGPKEGGKMVEEEVGDVRTEARGCRGGRKGSGGKGMQAEARKGKETLALKASRRTPLVRTLISTQ